MESPTFGALHVGGAAETLPPGPRGTPISFYSIALSRAINFVFPFIGVKCTPITPFAADVACGAAERVAVAFISPSGASSPASRKRLLIAQLGAKFEFALGCILRSSSASDLVAFVRDNSASRRAKYPTAAKLRLYEYRARECRLASH
jgi:hypothetical protein